MWTTPPTARWLSIWKHFDSFDSKNRKPKSQGRIHTSCRHKCVRTSTAKVKSGRTWASWRRGGGRRSRTTLTRRGAGRRARNARWPDDSRTSRRRTRARTGCSTGPRHHLYEQHRTDRAPAPVPPAPTTLPAAISRTALCLRRERHVPAPYFRDIRYIQDAFIVYIEYYFVSRNEVCCEGKVGGGGKIQKHFFYTHFIINSPSKTRQHVNFNLFRAWNNFSILKSMSIELNI